jgi:hypothetical protein
MQSRVSRPLSALVLAAASALVLTGCFAPGEVRPGEDVAPVPEGSETVVDAIEFPEPVATEAGQTLAFGEPAWVPIDMDGTATFSGAAVLDIQEGDPSFFEIFDNAEDFDGFTPYFVFVQRAWTDEDNRGELTLWPVYADQTDASVIETTTYGLGTLTACGDYAVPEFDNPDLEQVDCFVAASDTGQPVTGVRYDSTGKFTFVAPSNNPYFDAPLFWMAG